MQLGRELKKFFLELSTDFPFLWMNPAGTFTIILFFYATHAPKSPVPDPDQDYPKTKNNPNLFMLENAQRISIKKFM
jgi:hypothetical protein